MRSNNSAMHARLGSKKEIKAVAIDFIAQAKQG